MGTATLINGAATIRSNTLAVGDHPVTAVYLGSTIFAASESGAYVHRVNKAATVTALSITPESTVFGQALTLRTRVSVSAPGAGTPGGAITFKQGSAVLGSVTLAGGEASFTLSGLVVGAYNITAEYGGSVRYLTSISAPGAHTIGKAATTTVLEMTPNPAIIGETVLFTATVTTNAPGSGAPGGHVLFADGGTVIGASPIVNGVASFNTATLDVGSHSLTAQYAGSDNFAGSTSSPVEQIVKRKTLVTMTISPNPARVEQAVTFTVIVQNTPPGLDGVRAAALAAPSGSVEIIDEAGVVMASIPLLDGAGVYTTMLPGGVHRLQARYPGDATFGGSVSQVTTQTVERYRSTTTLGRSTSATHLGQPLTLLAEVVADASEQGAPTGNVAFLVNGVEAGVGVLQSGRATFTINSLTAGTHLIAAEYRGDARFDPSGSNPVFHTVDSSSYVYLPAVVR